MLPDQNPRIPEGINASQDNPLVEFAWLTAAVLLGIVLLVFVLSFTVRWFAPYVPFHWEQTISARFESSIQFESAAGDASCDEQRVAQATLENLARALVNSSLGVAIDGRHRVQSVPVDAYTFRLMPGLSPNAFATLGGHVMVTDALLQEVSSENGLSMVLAHEIAHIQLRHPLEALSRGVLLQLVMGLLLGGGDSAAVGGVVNSGSLLALLSFSRDMELAADARALQILRQHYGHVGGADEFFQSMHSAQDAALWVEFASTHPDSERRLALIARAMGEDVQRKALQPLPRALRPGVQQCKRGAQDAPGS
ncbi:MAG: M48 family metallopeptidase [Gammaproteobacteria bacterium]|nr:M48 family metallopeptidase [Gammaproteobacteria bacterium]